MSSSTQISLCLGCFCRVSELKKREIKLYKLIVSHFEIYVKFFGVPLKLKERLKELRFDNSLTQKEIATKMRISQNTYSQYENGFREPKLETLIRLAVILNTSTSYLIGELDSEKTVELSKLFEQLDEKDKLFIIETTKEKLKKSTKP